MADEVHFALKESVAKDFAGGSLAYGDGRTMNLKSRLGDDGVISTSDADEINALRSVPALKEVADSDSGKKAAAPDNKTKVTG